MKRLIIALSVALLSFGAIAQSPAVGFREGLLGMSLEDFRNVEFSYDWQTSTRSANELLCSDEAAGKNVSEPDRLLILKDSVIVCQVGRFWGTGSRTYHDSGMIEISPGSSFQDVKYHFVADKNGVNRLFLITGSFRSGSFGLVSEAFVNKYGKTREQNSVVQNGFGTKFQQKNHFWKKSAHTISLNRFGSDTGWGHFEIVDTSLEKAAIRTNKVGI